MQKLMPVLALLFLTCSLVFSSTSIHAATASSVQSASKAPRLFLLDPTVLQQTKQATATDPILKASLQALVQRANALLSTNTVSVMDKSQVLPGGNKHDYLSLATYFWPNPNTASHLPYIERDGFVNPEVFTYGDLSALDTMEAAVDALAQAYYFTGASSYATKATAFLQVWFLNKATLMNPNLNHSQLVKGSNTGRNEGIIDTKDFSHIVDDIGLLQSSTAWTTADQQGMVTWFGKFLTWLRTSAFGKTEAAAKNNHSTWYDEQTSAIAFFINQTSVAQGLLTTSATRHIDGHILADGDQPLEIVRPTSWHYCTWNLTALFRLALLGNHTAVDLWDYKNPVGAGLLTALNFVLPAALNPKVWTRQQVVPLVPTELVDVLYQAVAHYHNASYLKDARTIEGSTANTSIDNLLYGDGD